MKISYLVAILAIILLVGCAQEKAAVTPAETEPEPPVVETPTTTVPVEEKPVETPKSEIEVLVKGFEPAELTIKKGTTVKWVNTAPTVRILGGAVRSPSLKSGDTFEYTFDKAGEYTVIE